MNEEHNHNHDEGHTHGGLLGNIFGNRTEIIFSILCGVFLLLGWLTPKLITLPDLFSQICFILAYFFGGYFALQEVFEKIRTGRFEIDFLMLIAAGGAAILGEWAEGSLLLFLFSLGHALERYAMNRARNAISTLSELAPDTALVRRVGEEIEVGIDDLEIGDVVIVRSNERIAADGFVIAGESSVDQAPITGESTPVDKQAVKDRVAAAQNIDAIGPTHRVFAGTINGGGSLEIEVTRKSKDTTLARVVEMVSEAETRQSPTQSFTKRFEKIFVPIVILFAVFVAFAWLVIDEPASASFYRAMAVLVAASPCALAIATPSAILSGVARAARGGVLIKGGAPLESLGAISSIAFDKTGTLTKGEPRIVEINAFGGVNETELLSVAMAVELLSDHPLAKAVVRDASERIGQTDYEAHQFKSLTGKGVSAQIGPQTVFIGKPSMFDGKTAQQLPPDLKKVTDQMFEKGQTTMVVFKGEEFLGAIGLMDTPRVAAAAVISELRQLGVTRMMMISGDNQAVANTVAKDVGLDEAFGDLMPEDKVTKIAELSKEADVAMVGDGVNDAPAMANATVGIAMGAAGSDVALETADIALMGDDLRTLPFAVGLSRSTRKIIRQNLWVSLGIVAFLIPATLFGLGIGPAVFIHEGSTLIVVANALRLLGYQKV